MFIKRTYKSRLAVNARQPLRCDRPRESDSSGNPLRPVNSAHLDQIPPSPGRLAPSVAEDQVRGERHLIFVLEIIVHPQHIERSGFDVTPVPADFAPHEHPRARFPTQAQRHAHVVASFAE